mmetsp:Transcript_15929/g.37743  ORF Transcript_15929/g.37743 Transcript_15929/m.37743 type:complete len:104 (-) Transcript_15929:134-445(-)
MGFKQRAHSMGTGPQSQRVPPETARHLRTLGLPSRSDVSGADLRAAFLERAKEWHPDRHTGCAKTHDISWLLMGSCGKALAEAKFKGIQEAYRELRRLLGLGP